MNINESRNQQPSQQGSGKFEEGIMILLEYSITQGIQLTNLLSFFEIQLESEIKIKQGVQQQFVDYFLNIPELNQLCQMLNLKDHIYDANLITLDQNLIYQHLSQQIDQRTIYVQQNYFENCIKERELTYFQERTDILLILNQIVESQLAFPQIVCGLQFKQYDKQLIFNLELNLQFIQMVRDFQSSSNLKPLVLKMDESQVIQNILINTNRSNIQDQLKFFKAEKICKLFSSLNQINYSDFAPSIIYEQLIQMFIRKENAMSKFKLIKFRRIAVAAYLYEYINLNIIYPNLIRQILVHKLQPNNIILTLRTSRKFLKEISSHPRVHNIIDLHQGQDKYNKFSNLNNTDILIGKMFEMIFQQKERIQGELYDLFGKKKVQELVEGIQQLGQATRSIRNLLKLNEYVVRFSGQIRQFREVVFISDIERYLARQNMRIVMKMMVEQQVVIPELISYLRCPYSSKQLPAVTFTDGMDFYNFIENEESIEIVLKQYGVSSNEQCHLLKINLMEIQLKIRFSEQICIIHILEIIEKEKWKYKQRLQYVMQQKSVKQLMKQLKKIYILYKESSILQACIVYKILSKIQLLFK